MSDLPRPTRPAHADRSAATGRSVLPALVLALLVAGCTLTPATAVPASPSLVRSTAPPASAPPPSQRATVTPTPIVRPSATAAPADGASCVARVLAGLTEGQRIGQLFSVGLPHDRVDSSVRDAVATHHLGSWWFTQRTSAGRAAIRVVTDEVQAQATEAATGRIGSFVAANQEGGRIQALSGPGFDTIPAALAQGRWSTATLRTRAERWGRQLLAAGVNQDFAPVADVVPSDAVETNAPIGRLEREYGLDPSSVASHVEAFIQGMTRAGVATTVKHFPGLGRVAENTDVASGVVDTATAADDPYLEPFRRAIDARVPAVMLSLATYERIDPDRIAAFSWRTIGGLLEDDLGFDGVVMSDSLSAEAVSAIPAGTRAIRFLDDGGDMIVVRPVRTAIVMADALVARAREDEWFRRRIDDAASRVLRAKEAAGLLPCGG